MRIVEPRVFLVGETRLIDEEFNAYLEHVGAPEWRSIKSQQCPDAPTDIEKMPEIMGRLCYRSWKPKLNPNVTRVREGNDEYLNNILKSAHGSVLEHSFINFIFANVSRVFTHELVRHRVGVAISQESLRFVRLDNLGFWPPLVLREYADAIDIMMKTVGELEKVQVELAKILKLDELTKFEQKKKLTSAMRRVANIGLATTIGWSANIRTLRHVIEMRTNPGAEEEIRLVFGLVAEKLKSRYPNLFGDYTVEVIDGLPWYKTEYRKV
ncbi:MAG: FAD-dependent thymidylate synthase [Candidatus Sungiibacteriota bacterium]|uniref:FAD-dependent thymidylate synthase n=1 Tax=Candidatus Sungiibacteriota bacterium TaxID=2750080 RepID=A0A7T5UR22_9BACT|nr:MAG: FAD-dependent thymidylate synthase [Candidatus Sungbacteria bacterium]